MQEPEVRPAHPALKKLVVEASQALARLDAPRLEELALSCQALNRDLQPMSADDQREMARQASEASADMAVFGRVLDATRANLAVMNRLREMRVGRLEYSERQARGGTNPWSPSTDPGRSDEGAEGGHGDD